MTTRLLVVLLLCSVAVQASEIKGKIVNVVGGEALGRVQVSLLETGAISVTSDGGVFAIKAVPPGSYTLRVTAVGYRALNVPFTLSAGEEEKVFEITLAPDNFQRQDTIEVRGDIFQASDSAAVVESNLVSSELRQASTVFADDPFRAIQALPGVSASANNELFAEFSVMGAPFDNVGVYLDDVLIPRPFHSARNFAHGASLSLLTSETIEEMKLMPVAYPEKYGDDIGAALDVRTREGSRTAPLFRLSVGMADSDLLAEGGLGKSKKGSWLASVRKSYLGYLVRNLMSTDYSDTSFYDGDLKLTYDITPSQNLSFYGLGGHANVKVHDQDLNIDPNTVKQGADEFIFLRTGWRWSVTPHLLLDSRAAHIRQPLTQDNSYGQRLSRDAYSEWVGGSTLVWNWKRDHVLDAGGTLRRIADNFVSSSYATPGEQPVLVGVNQNTLRGDGYIQQSSTFWNNRLHVLGGVRWDARRALDSRPMLPQMSVALQVHGSTHLLFGFGKYNQFLFPDFVSPASCPGGAGSFQRSTHYTAGVEQRFGENTRFQVNAFARGGEDFLSALNTSNCAPVLNGNVRIRQSHARGGQIILQRRSANRLSGWVGYTLVYARQSDLYLEPGQISSLYSPYYAGLEDQRHSLNAFASYRLAPSVALSAKILYGSGFPVVSGFESGPDGVPQPVPVQRMGPYLRMDLRSDKSWTFEKWKLTLYAELLNVTNHDNRIFTSFVEVNRQIVVHSQSTLPTTPTVGLVFEF